MEVAPESDVVDIVVVATGVVGDSSGASVGSSGASVGSSGASVGPAEAVVVVLTCLFSLSKATIASNSRSSSDALL